jgi:prolipoprotein diacylglyceryltransferase
VSGAPVGRWLEALLAGAAPVRWPPLGLTLQAGAMVVAFAWFLHRTRGPMAGLRVCLLAGYGGAALGAMALGVAIRVPAWVRSGLDHGVLLRAGAAGYGALIGLSVAYAALARARGHGIAEALDRLAPCLGVLVLVARAGCFLAGCDFGAVTAGALGVRYPPGSPAFREHLAQGWILPSDRASLAVHPTQLYEAALGLVMAVLALWVERRAARGAAALAPRSPAFLTAAVAYAIGRAAIEALRGDPARGGLGPLSTAQWISLAVLVTVLVAVAARARSPSGRRSR